MYLTTCRICLEIYELDPAHFFSATGLAWQIALKETKEKLDLLTDIDVIMVENRIKTVLEVNMSCYSSKYEI